MAKVTRFCIFVFCVFGSSYGFSADKKDDGLLSDTTFAGLKLRGIGPAFMSGRIADIAINPSDPSQWYVAVGSGGVWKTNNASTTWQPIFDDQPSYSVGCVSIDPNEHTVIWVGTGENVGGRKGLAVSGNGNGLQVALRRTKFFGFYTRVL